MLALLLQLSVELPKAEDVENITTLLIKMVVVLAVVCVGAWITIKFLLPRLGMAKFGRQGRAVEVLGRFNLEPKKFLWIVRVGQRRFLLGSTEAQISCVAELTAKDLEADDAV